MTRWAAGLMMAACLVLASSCGGDGGNGNAPSPGMTSEPGTASASVARINAAQGVLALPLLQSGELLYADVRIGFLADGTFNLLSWRLADTASNPADAVLQPQLALAGLERSAQKLKLTIGRLHMDAAVYDNVTVELENGRWRYQPLVPAMTLTSQDLRANPALFARDHQLTMISSTPARAEVFSLRLENKNYQFCMEAQDDGADTMALLDGQGNELLTVRAGGPCAAYSAEQGLYQIRYTYGGAGTGRTLFMRQRPTDLPAVTQPANASPLLQAASNPKEYWGVLASFLDPATQRVKSSSFLGMAGSWRQEGRHPGSDCAGSIAAVVTPTALTPQKPNDLSVATHLFDARNFFERIDDDAGNPKLLGPPWGCNSELLGFYTLFFGESAMVMGKFNSGPAATHPVRIDSFSALSNTFILKGASGKKGVPLPDSPLGFPFSVEPRLFPSGLRPLTPEQFADALPEYRTVLRYRPDGFARLASPALGQVALFNSRDCSGAAMVVDNYDLPGIMAGGPLGNFDGSLKLGAQTTATVYSGQRQQGERQQLNTVGCIASGWGASSWKAASLSIIAGSVQFLVSSKSCEQCNLAGANLARADLSNGKFAGAILNNANLAQANLSGADLRYASLQGAQLPNANLDAANLCAANLNAAPASASLSTAAANLSGAFLRNAYLYGANLAGANFGDASFFSTSAGSCQANACDSYHRPACASAYSATLEGTKFNNAYLAGVDMSNVAGRGADFSHAVLNGAWLRNATLTPNANGAAVNFSNAFLQGADFTNATIDNAIFNNAYVDTAPGGGCMQFELDRTHTAFPGFSVPTPPGSNTCARAAAPAPTCVQFTYNRPTILTAQVGSPTIPLNQASPSNSTCSGVAPLCGDAFTGVGPNTCWSTP